MSRTKSPSPQAVYARAARDLGGLLVDVRIAHAGHELDPRIVEVLDSLDHAQHNLIRAATDSAELPLFAGHVEPAPPLAPDHDLIDVEYESADVVPLGDEEIDVTWPHGDALPTVERKLPRIEPERFRAAAIGLAAPLPMTHYLGARPAKGPWVVTPTTLPLPKYSDRLWVMVAADMRAPDGPEQTFVEVVGTDIWMGPTRLDPDWHTAKTFRPVGHYEGEVVYHEGRELLLCGDDETIVIKFPPQAEVLVEEAEPPAVEPPAKKPRKSRAKKAASAELPATIEAEPNEGVAHLHPAYKVDIEDAPGADDYVALDLVQAPSLRAAIEEAERRHGADSTYTGCRLRVTPADEMRDGRREKIAECLECGYRWGARLGSACPNCRPKADDFSEAGSAEGTFAGRVTDVPAPGQPDYDRGGYLKPGEYAAADLGLPIVDEIKSSVAGAEWQYAKKVKRDPIEIRGKLYMATGGMYHGGLIYASYVPAVPRGLWFGMTTHNSPINSTIGYQGKPIEWRKQTYVLAHKRDEIRVRYRPDREEQPADQPAKDDADAQLVSLREVPADDAPATPAALQLFDVRMVKQISPSAWINTPVGQVEAIDEVTALAAAKLKFAGTDVELMGHKRPVEVEFLQVAAAEPAEVAHA